MLLDLKVLNGQLVPVFNSNVFEYTVYIKDVNQLELSYVTLDDLPLTIYGNEELTDGENHVILEIFNEKVITYTLTVYKNSEKEVLQSDNLKEKVEVDTKSIILDDILTPGIITVCFILILVLYIIIFRKK